MLRVTRQNVEALVAGDGKIRITRQNVEVLAAVSAAAIERAATDTLTFSGVARSIVKILTATDTLTLSGSATSSLRKLSATDTLVLSGVVSIGSTAYKSCSDTITLDQTASSWINRLDAIDHLSIFHASDFVLNRLTITDILSFYEETRGRVPVITEPPAVNSLVFSQNSTVWRNRLVATDQLVFAQTLDNTIKARVLNQTLTLTDVASLVTAETPQATNVLTFTEVVILGGLLSGLTASQLSFTELVKLFGRLSLISTNDLIDDELIYDDTTGLWYWQHNGLGDAVTCERTANPGEQNTISLTESVGLIHVHASATPLSASDTLVFVQSGELFCGNDFIILTDVATVDASKAIKESFTLTDLVSLEQDRNLLILEPLGLRQALSYNLIRACTYCRYSPFVGDSSDPDAPTPPSITPPTIVRQNNIQLTYGATVLTLRGPNHGNTDASHFTRIKRETRGGTLIVFADPIWPKVQTMVIEFSGLSETEAQSILSFTQQSFGKEIDIRDWENQTWKGVITTPDNPIVRNGRGNNSVALELDVRPI